VVTALHQGIVYARQFGSAPLTFGVSGKLIMNALVMYDRQSDSLWSQFLGVAVEGRFRGTALEPVPAMLTDWRTWRELTAVDRRERERAAAEPGMAGAETLGLPLVDRETGTLWAGLTGEVVAGPVAGRRLARLNAMPVFWFAWNDFHPLAPRWTPPPRSAARRRGRAPSPACARARCDAPARSDRPRACAMLPPDETRARELSMDWKDSADQAAFRAQVRQVIENKLPERYRAGDGDWERDRKSEDVRARDAATAWTAALAEQGWVAPHWPKEFGGAGLSPMEQFIFKQEMAQSGAPSVGGQGVSQLGPTLIVHGSDEQKAQHLPKILSGEVDWRQGYSEPGAGSDLASLQTRAIRDGDDYVINGQKIWTSLAHHADWLYVLTRTDPNAPKHRGISFLLVDKSTPGITVRPLIDMSFRHHFNEVFFEDVRVPASNRVGEENRGWYVGMTLLDYERSNITGAVANRRTLNKLMAYLGTPDGKAKSTLADNPGLRLEIADRAIETEVMFNYSFRIISMQARGLIPNYEASMSKLYNSELNQRTAHTGTKLFGLHSNVWPGDAHAAMEGEFTRTYVSSVSSTIAAGTSEIQRNIIATRGLGLPRG